MTADLSRRLALIFLAFFTGEGVLGLVATGVPSLAVLVPFVEWTLVALASGLMLGILLSPRIPKTLLLPAIGYVVWSSICGGFPLWFDLRDSTLAALSIGQVLLGSGLLLLACFRFPEVEDRPQFTWKNFALSGIFLVVAVPAAAVVGIINAAATGIEARTGGYASLRPSGLYCEERRFHRGTKEIRLVGMIHIAQADFYGRVSSSLTSRLPAIVLLEGVSDHHDLLTSGYSYKRLAEIVGATAQDKSPFPSPPQATTPAQNTRDLHFQIADVDVSSFHPDTIWILNAMGSFLADPFEPGALRAFSQPGSPANKPGAQATLLNDILTERNAHLTRQIHSALTGYDTVIVPWGAMHLPEIETSLKSWGFIESARIRRAAFKFY